MEPIKVVEELNGSELTTVVVIDGGGANIKEEETVIPAALVSYEVLLVALTVWGTVVLKQAAVPPREAKPVGQEVQVKGEAT